MFLARCSLMHLTSIADVPRPEHVLLSTFAHSLVVFAVLYRGEMPRQRSAG